MKSTLKLSALALAVFLASCGDSETSTTTTTDSNADTKSTMSAEPASPPAGTADAGMSDQDFVTQASAMNMAEVNAHKTAKSRAVTANVKMHAGHMLTDHTKMGDEMKALADKKGMTLATEPPAEKKQMLDEVSAKKGKDFDAAYVDAQVKDHEEAIALFEKGSASVKDADLKALIDKTLPTLRSHLEMVKDAQSKMNN